MNIIPEAAWPAVVEALRQHCPRLTPADFADSGRRVDLLTAKIQNRHWISRIAARRVVMGVVGTRKTG